jgi:hypothetical protein
MKHFAKYLVSLLVMTSTALILCLSPVTVHAATEGWASQTGFRNAETEIQKRIVSLARSQVGKLSPGSTTYGPWQTDTASGDGARMRNAINIYANACYFRTGCNLTTVRSQMFGAFASSAYGSTQKNKLIDRIISYFDYFRTHYGPPLIPWDDETTLRFFGIRAQCFEWVQTQVKAAGGRTKSYSTSGVSNAASYRPGMGLYRTNATHAMIIVDIYWDRYGTPLKFRVVDSNYGSGWVNPNGEIPWDRHIRQREEGRTGNKVVNFDF